MTTKELLQNANALERNKRISQRYDELMLRGKHGHFETMFQIVREEVERDSAALVAEIERLREALGWFLNDTRFQVAVGGNPIVVDKMLAAARQALTGERE